MSEIVCVETVEFGPHTKTWYYDQDGKWHREYGPAVTDYNGDRYWYRHGLLHCDDGPAIKYINGSREWIVNGKWHREDGPAIDLTNGNQAWFKHGELHNPNGPALISLVQMPDSRNPGFFAGRIIEYRIDGLYHNVDGPAVILTNNDFEYWINGKQLSCEEWFKRKNVFDKP